MIEIRNISKTFELKNKKILALNNVGLEIKKGEIVGYSGTGEDSCWISTDGTTANGGGTNKCETEFTNNGRCYVSEYYCEGDSKKNEIIPCPNGCSEGACL